MEIIQKFLDLYVKENVKDVVPFLRKLSGGERKAIAKVMEKLRQVNRNWQVYCAYNGFISIDQHAIIAYANFFCLGKEDVKYIEYHWRDLPKFEEMEKLLEEEVPEGFPELYAQVLLHRLHHVTYEQVMRLLRKGFVSKEGLEPFLALRMVDVFPRFTETDDPVGFINDRLTAYPEVLDEQVWYLFEYPHEVSYTDKSNNMKVGGKTGPWSYALKTYSLSGRLDRMRLFRACISVTDLFFKKDQLNWYVDLFEAMEPTTTELLTLQDELFASLSSTLSKKVNMGLSMIRKIASEKEFRREEFLQLVPVLLTSDIKATVTAALAVLEVLAKTDKNLRDNICQVTATAFLCKDEAIQTRAAKLIAKYAGSTDACLKTVLQSYLDTILQSVKPLLGDLLSATDAVVDNAGEVHSENLVPEDTTPVLHITEDNRLVYIKDIEELIFRIPQAISHFTMTDFYLIPEALVRMQDEVTEEILHKFAPLIQSAYKRIAPYDTNRTLFIDLLCLFFQDYCKLMFERFPDGDPSFGKFRAKSLEFIDMSLKSREYMDDHFPEPFVMGYRMLMGEYIEKVKMSDHLPVLCTPTHSPTWLAPEVLIERLEQYDKAGCTPGTMDMQQALQLCSLQTLDKALSLAAEKLTGECRELLVWFLNPATPLPTHRLHPEWWLAAAMMQTGREVPPELMHGFEYIPQQNLTGVFTAEPYIQEDIYSVQVNAETGEKEPLMHLSSRFRVDVDEVLTENNKNTNFFAGHSFSRTHRRLNNMEGLMLSSPNNWQTQVGFLFKRVLQYATQTTDKYVIPVLEVYRQARVHLRQHDYMLLAYCMFSSDKTVRNYAAETWHELTDQNQLDNSALGDAAGALAKIEYAPLKRFNELVEKNMLGVSPIHNKGLEKILARCLSQLPETAPAGVKKLLELYKEVLALNNSYITPDVFPHLKAWQEEPSLKKVMKQLKDKMILTTET